MGLEMKSLFPVMVILTIMFEPFSTAYPNDGGAGLDGVGFVAGGLTVIISGFL